MNVVITRLMIILCSVKISMNESFECDTFGFESKIEDNINIHLNFDFETIA